MKAMLPDRGIPGAKVRLSFWPGRIQAIGTQDADGLVAEPGAQLGLARASLAADLAKARGNHHGAEHTFGDALLQRGQDLDGRYRDDGEVDGFLEGENGGDCR